ncbi:hypothetical protein L2E82_17677 [Cichorium intybus]|uniref:Uncharacterized protein n=1 Tax=Cichorium intybus TaxID=13427 RepID=A0ACB9F840_CICIN|nr:hypothetical protein L2E82_17677 [Cichorium intybus]
MPFLWIHLYDQGLDKSNYKKNSILPTSILEPMPPIYIIQKTTVPGVTVVRVFPTFSPIPTTCYNQSSLSIIFKTQLSQISYHFIFFISRFLFTMSKLTHHCCHLNLKETRKTVEQMGKSARNIHK